MFTVLDRSNYLKGLLILAKKDNRLVHQEKDIIRSIAQDFGFSKDFYEDVLKNLMANKYIKDDPIIFSDQKIAESFLRDGIKLASSDDNLDANELAWLKKTAIDNSITNEAFEQLIADFHRTNKDNKTSTGNKQV